MEVKIHTQEKEMNARLKRGEQKMVVNHRSPTSEVRWVGWKPLANQWKVREIKWVYLRWCESNLQICYLHHQTHRSAAPSWSACASPEQLTLPQKEKRWFLISPDRSWAKYILEQAMNVLILALRYINISPACTQKIINIRNQNTSASHHHFHNK